MFFGGKYCEFYLQRANRCNVSGYEQRIPNNKYCEKYDQYLKCPWFLYWKQGKGNGRFYITTLICELLNKPEDDPVLTGLTNFRENVLEKDEKYSEFLRIYDVIGPEVCCKIFGDENATEKAEKIYPKLARFAELVDNAEYDKAAEAYIAFTLGIVAEYGMQEEYRKVRDNGKKMTKTLE